METTKKILIIDDEEDLADMIGFQFKSKGFEVQTAKDGVEGLEKSHEFLPDLIILDMNMPRMGGIEFYSKICDAKGVPMCPVLVLTARANVQGLFKDLKIDGFMTKPFDIEQLISQVELIMKNRAQMSKLGTREYSRKIGIVENNQLIFDQISGIFLNEGYTVIPSKNGMSGIDRMMMDPPDVAAVQLGLTDIAGDIVIYRLSQMARTMSVKFVLYTSRDAKHDARVMERIASKTGVFTFVEYKTLEDVLVGVKQLF